MVLTKKRKTNKDVKKVGKKPTISEVLTAVNNLSQQEAKHWIEQEEFNKTIINRLDNIVKLNNLKE